MTTTLAAPSVTDTAVADLVLVRMALPGKNPVGPKDVRKDVGKLLGFEFSVVQLDEIRNELATAGFLTKGKRQTFTLNDTGRERALRFLGIDELPPRMNWSLAVSKYLFPKATGLSADAAAKLDSGDRLAAFILKRKYELTGQAGSTVSQVLEAVACRELGFSDETTLNGVMCFVLNRLIGSDGLAKDKLAQQLPLFETGLTSVKADAVRNKIVRDWLGGAPLTPQPHESSPAEPLLPSGAVRLGGLRRDRARRLAEGSPAEDRFHDNKVFIAPLWRASQREPSFPPLSLREFKLRLVEANSQNLLYLSRADLVQAMDPQLVSDSETAYLNATFHFVLLEGERP